MTRGLIDTFRRAASAALLAAAVSCVPMTALADPGIPVVMNQAKIVRLTRPADTIVIGNPEIADAAVQDARTIVLTGRGFGVTNMVILDAEGELIADEQIVVTRQTAESVRIYRRANIQTLSCTPYCEGAYKSSAERMSEQEMGTGR